MPDNDVVIQFDEEEFIKAVQMLQGEYVEKPAEPKKEVKEIRVGISYPDFQISFRKYFPNIKVVKSPQDLDNYDLLIVPGGEDVNPSLYSQENRYSFINEYRDGIEIPIVKRAIRINKKIYAVCRGHQLVNVLCGGILIQDLIDEVGYDHPGNHPLENICSDAINKFFGNKNVISTHHQAVHHTPLRVTSSYKGIIESCENKYIISTQFHPEFQDGNEKFFEYVLNWATY